MPSSYYCADNFFKKMTDLDSPRRNNDCYFYYYSTCAKGDSCTFRHEPSALGCETMCSFWKEGKCLNVHCNFRHMELRKNRKAIQCYWETQPGGCLKPHCPFLHQNVKQSRNEYTGNNIGTNCGPNTDTSQISKQSDVGQAPEKNFKNPVDSLVVNFEEESDNESAPSFSPVKTQVKKLKVKTLEEIRLEKIQEESAAYFSYHETEHPLANTEVEDDLRKRLLVKMRQKKLQQEDSQEVPSKRKRLTFAENTTLDEHIKILTGEQKVIVPQKSSEYISLDEHIFHKRKQKFDSVPKKEDKKLNTIKIKTLSEIRAERQKKQEHAEPDSQFNQTYTKKRICSAEDEVTSTSKDETETVKKENPRKRLKLKRFSPESSRIEQSEKELDEIKINPEVAMEKEENLEANLELRVSAEEDNETVQEEVKRKNIFDPVDFQPKLSEEEMVLNSTNVDIDSDTSKFMDKIDANIEREENSNETNSIGSDHFPNKLAEEVLLLDDDEDYGNVTLKAEDELLEEIDDILGR